jgi:hypothetical protein
METSERQLNFRIDTSLADWIKSYAKENRRSVSAQLTLMIEQEKAYVEKSKQGQYHPAN